MSTLPGVVLVHGLWGDGAHWAGVIGELHRRGIDDVRAVELPLVSLDDDVRRTEQLVDQLGGPVVLAGHSYGGVVISAAGNHPSVTGLVYAAALVPDAGDSAATLSEAQPGSAFGNVVADDGGFLWLRHDTFQESFAHDVDDDQARVMALTQKPPQAALLGEPVKDPAWTRLPSWYQLSTQDRVVHPENQRRMAERIAPRRLLELASSHASPASHPAEIAGLIEEAVRATAS